MPHLAAVSDERDAYIRTVLSSYSLRGSIISITKNVVGLVNETFVVRTDTDMYILRQSSPVTSYGHIELEVEILRFLETKGFSETARMVPNNTGEYITNIDGTHYVLQTFLPGEIKATSVDVKNLTLPMFKNFCAFTARFSKAVQDFPRSAHVEALPRLQHVVSKGDASLNDVIERMSDSVGKDFVLARIKDLRAFRARTEDMLKEVDYDALPKQLVHFDIHPGNVHFDGDKVVAFFDFDWARFDSRFSDLATTIGQSCYVIGGSLGGTYDKRRVHEGLSAYRQSYGSSEFSVERENEILRAALQGYMFFQVLWAIDWYSANSTAESSFDVLSHFVSVCLVNDFYELFS